MIPVNGAQLHYTERGQGEPVVFSHGFLWSGRMFDAQVAALEKEFRCITFDHRGQGQSQVTAGGYDLDALTEDARQLLQALGAAPCHFVGLSMGGFVGMRLAARHPELIRSLTLLETSAEPEPPKNAPRYRLLGKAARYFGLRLVSGPVMKIMFGKKFLKDPARRGLREEMKRQLLSVNIDGMLRTLDAIIGRKPVVDELGKIRAPTLIMVGDQDVATVPAKARRIQQGIPGSRLEVIPGGGHTSTVEEPDAINALLAPFLRQHRAGG